MLFSGQTTQKRPNTALGIEVSSHPISCSCNTCTCPDELMKLIHGKPVNPATKDNTTQNVQIVRDGETSVVASNHNKNLQVKSSLVNKSSTVKQSNRTTQLESIDISKLDDVTLMSKIETGRKENCECREQIKEIRRALNKIKCACTEAEMKAGKNKAVFKQPAAFGETMSGLKLALQNLQEKCKAKDKMIEAMTGELRARTSSNTLNKVLKSSFPDVLDYDRAKFVKTASDAHSTNVIYPVAEERVTKVDDYDTKMSNAMLAERPKSRPKSSKSCKCGKIHKDRESTRINLAGFEIIDIRRITPDSIIIKWKSPKSNQVTGYDIFVNGVHKSKVMSGGRTSAMIHSLDLSTTIQITIYAVTKCGRCEPPAIAIYEIK